MPSLPARSQPVRWTLSVSSRRGLFVSLTSSTLDKGAPRARGQAQAYYSPAPLDDRTFARSFASHFAFYFPLSLCLAA